MGRPSKFDQEIADKIVDITSTTSRSLASICKELEVSPSTVYKWLIEDEKFSEMYARGKDWQADFMAEETIEIADDSSQDKVIVVRNGEPVEVENKEYISRSRLRVDARKWIASKLKPRKYGESIKADITSGGEKIQTTIIRWGDKEIEV